MSPEYPLKLAILDVAADWSARVQYVSTTKGRLTARIDDRDAAPGFRVVGDGVASVRDTDDLEVDEWHRAPPLAKLGTRFRWLENLRPPGPGEEAPWLGAIAIFPGGAAVRDIDPSPLMAFDHAGRLALYWALRVDATGHAAVSWTPAQLRRPLADELAALGAGDVGPLQTELTEPGVGGPGDGAPRILLMTVTRVETRAVFERIRALTGQEPSYYGSGDVCYFDLGLMGGARVFLTQSQMGAGGPGGAQSTASKALEKLAPVSVIMTGIAFGMSSETQAIGDVLVSRQLQDYEPQRVGAETEIPRGDRVTGSPSLVQRCQDEVAIRADGEPTVHIGLLLSGAKLVDSAAFKAELSRHWPEAIGGEMEGAGLYAAAVNRDTPWIVIKAICDWGEQKRSRKEETNQQLAAANAAAFVVDVISRGGW
jgi:nucleoside phosphorylase